jgi:hypothetical protein
MTDIIRSYFEGSSYELSGGTNEFHLTGGMKFVTDLVYVFNKKNRRHVEYKFLRDEVNVVYFYFYQSNHILSKRQVEINDPDFNPIKVIVDFLEESQ